MKRKKNISIKVIVLLLLIGCKSSYSKIKEFSTVNKGEMYKEQLAKYFRNCKVYKLNTIEIANYVRSQPQKALFALDLGTVKYNLEIEVNEMRSDDFQAIAMSDEGPKEVIQTFANTYKGNADGNKSAIVRLTLDESVFEGYINKTGRILYFDKLSRYITKADDGLIVAYYGEDVISDASKICGSDKIEEGRKIIHDRINNNKMMMTGNCYFLEIATEADYDYYITAGSNPALALQRIRSIYNLVEGFYTSAFNVKFIIKYQRIWTTSNDPYSGDSLQVILPQFQSEWNNNMTGINRDVTQMFTSRTLLNSTIGIAYPSVICSAGSNYSVMSNNTIPATVAVCVTAHELGHNFGSPHDVGTCNGNIMCPYNQGSNLYWSSASINSISNFIGSLGLGSCLSELFSTNATLVGSSVQQSYIKTIASNDITLVSTAWPLQLSSSGFGYIEAGHSVVITPSLPNSIGFRSFEGSSLVIRISDVTTSCDVLSRNGSVASENVVHENNNLSIFPNPFNSEINLSFNLIHDERVKLILYNTSGLKVKELLTGNLIKGLNKLTFDGNDFAPGVYMLILQSADGRQSKKIIKAN